MCLVFLNYELREVCSFKFSSVNAKPKIYILVLVYGFVTFIYELLLRKITGLDALSKVSVLAIRSGHGRTRTYEDFQSPDLQSGAIATLPRTQFITYPHYIHYNMNSVSSQIPVSYTHLTLPTICSV